MVPVILSPHIFGETVRQHASDIENGGESFLLPADGCAARTDVRPAILQPAVVGAPTLASGSSWVTALTDSAATLAVHGIWDRRVSRVAAP